VTAAVEHGEVFAALADPTRRRVLDLLATHGHGTATSLAAELPVSRPAVIKHLTVLDRAGLVESRRLGREVRYSVRSEPLDSAARWMARVAADWDERLTALKRMAEAEQRLTGGQVGASPAAGPRA
jgi:DNA-binding transcriptional ArsR family regulator